MSRVSEIEPCFFDREALLRRAAREQYVPRWWSERARLRVLAAFAYGFGPPLPMTYDLKVHYAAHITANMGQT